MRSRTVMVGALAGLLIVALWYSVLLKPIRADVTETKSDVQTAEQETQEKQNELRRLQSLEDQGPENQAELEQLRAAVPEQPELASFIDEAYAIGVEAGVEWVSVAPTEPVPGPGVSSIQLAINVEGGYFQVLNYLTLLEDLSRLVVVDSINLTAGSEGSGEGAEGDPTASIGGAPTLSAQLTGRMFTQAQAEAATSAKTRGGATTTTTPAAEG